MNQLIKVCGLLATIGALAACNQAPTGLETNPNVQLAKAWVTAGSSSRSAAMEMIEQNMADDGLFYRDRYVGFGFLWDNQDSEYDGRMVISNVIPESPVSDILKPGDEFISVEGIEVNSENMGRLPFRGKPGEAVTGVILRDGEELDVEVSRGVVSAPATKADMLEWMGSGDEEDWGPDKWTLHEAIGEGNVVYVWTQSWNTDDDTGLPFEAHQVTRMEFNDVGKVSVIGSLSEDRFVLEQTGYNISR